MFVLYTDVDVYECRSEGKPDKGVYVMLRSFVWGRLTMNENEVSIVRTSLNEQV